MANAPCDGRESTTSNKRKRGYSSVLLAFFGGAFCSLIIIVF